MSSPEFQQLLIAALPSLRARAMRLTCNHTAAEDLVQDVAVKALVAHEAFSIGTNFMAWIRRIMLNHFLSGIRGKRETRNLDDLAEVAIPAQQQNATDLRELSVVFQQLPDDQKHVFRLVALEENTYEEVSAECGLAIGTLKSRLHRARRQFRRALLDQPEPAIPALRFSSREIASSANSSAHMASSA